MADRLGKQYEILARVLADMTTAPNGTYYSIFSTIPESDVQIPMIDAADAADEIASTGTARVIKSLIPLTNLVDAFEKHLRKNGTLSAGTWDSYCEYQDIRVSDHTNQVYYARKNKYMKAKNVFCEDDVLMGSCCIIDSQMAFDAGRILGTGSQTALADGSDFAASSLRVLLNTDIVSPISIRIMGPDEFGAVKAMDVEGLIAGPSGVSIPITPPSGRFTGIYSAILLSGGNDGDEFQIFNIKDRIIQL